MENEGKLYKVIISDDAAHMLVSHSRFLSQVSEKEALQLIDEVVDCRQDYGWLL